MEQVILERALWSPSYSQCLTGYDPNGEFVHTSRVFADCSGNYIDPVNSIEYTVKSWAPDGRGYSDRKKAL